MAEMYGSVDWMITFLPADVEPIAEIYDEAGNLKKQKPVPCRPPFNCSFTMNDVEVGMYKAALVYDGKRYYYVQGESAITQADDLDGASLIGVTETITPYVEFTVDAS